MEGPEKEVEEGGGGGGKRRLSGGTGRPCVVCVSIAGALLGATKWALIFVSVMSYTTI